MLALGFFIQCNRVSKKNVLVLNQSREDRSRPPMRTGSDDPPDFPSAALRDEPGFNHEIERIDRRVLSSVVQTPLADNSDGGMKPPHRQNDAVRCECGNLLAKLTRKGLEVKCRRCKRKQLLSVRGLESPGIRGPDPKAKI